MRRALHILLNGLTVLSLLSCAALSVMWVRSYPGGYAKRDFIAGRSSGGTYDVSSYLGAIQWDFTPDVPTLHVAAPAGGSGESGTTVVHDPVPGLIWAEHWITQYVGGRPPVTWVQRRDGRLDYWLPVLISLLIPFTRLGLWRWRQRLPQAGHCPACGYDLRASPERCPECGRPSGGDGNGAER